MAKKKMARISKWTDTPTKSDADRHALFEQWVAITKRRARIFKLWNRLCRDQDAHPTWWAAIDAENERLWKEDQENLAKYRKLLR